MVDFHGRKLCKYILKVDWKKFKSGIFIQNLSFDAEQKPLGLTETNQEFKLLGNRKIILVPLFHSQVGANM